MSDYQKKWVTITAGSNEGESAEKKLVSSNYKDILLGPPGAIGIGSTKISYKVKGFWQDVRTFRNVNYDTLLMPDSGRMMVEGSPEIPQEGLFVAIPENAVVKDIKVIRLSEKELGGKYYILPASKPVHEGEEPEYIPDKNIYGNDKKFPGKTVEYLGMKTVAGKNVAHILVYLIQYEPKSQKVKALESVDLEIIYEKLPDKDIVSKKLHDYSPLKLLILDSESMDECEKLKKSAPAKTGIDDTGLKSPNNEGEYLIITTNDLKNSVTPLVSAKSLYYKVMTVTKEDILKEFPDPKEDQAIKNFLIYASEHWKKSPHWVVLAGNIDKIPVHIEDNIASDSYYADLCGDHYPQLSVSRLPVSNAQDMTKICTRAAKFNSVDGDWRNKILFTAYESDNYIDCKNTIAQSVGTTFQVAKKYAGQASKDEVLNTLNSGAIITNYRGHGANTYWCASNGLNAEDVRERVKDGDETPLVFSIACWNCNLDMGGECFGVTWIKNEKAITFLGASRPSYTNINHEFDKFLFDGILNQKLTNAGDIMNWGTAKLLQNFPGQYTIENVRMYLMLGDPTADLKPATSESIIPVIDQSGSMGENNYLDAVKTSTAAFLNIMHPNENLSIVAFSDDSRVIFPEDGSEKLVTIIGQETINQAGNTIKPLQLLDMTNIKSAIDKSHGILSTKTKSKAMLLISDGVWNKGEDPLPSLPSDIPIYAVATGIHANLQFMQQVANKTHGKLYCCPGSDDLQGALNAIIGDLGIASVVYNQKNTIQPFRFKSLPVTISAMSRSAYFTVAWTNTSVKYASGTPQGKQVNVSIRNPSGQKYPTPDAFGDGFAVFKIPAPTPGEWDIVCWCGDTGNFNCTVAVFELGSPTNVNMQVLPRSENANGTARIGLQVHEDGIPVPDIKVDASIEAPSMSIHGLLDTYKQQLDTVQPLEELTKDGVSEPVAKLMALLKTMKQEKEILPTRHFPADMQKTDSGAYKCSLSGIEPGVGYTIHLNITGYSPRTRSQFMRSGRISLLATE